jgi:hypothetical protein
VSIDRFAWLARMQAMPLLSAHILDGYVDGEGLLEARFCGSLPLVRAAGQEISRGELMRYLAELIWAPHAMQRNPQLSWREIDASAVEVSAASPGGPARVGLFRGWRYRSHRSGRPPACGRTSHSADAVGRILRDYREMEGFRIPTRAAVSWLLDGNPF